MRFCMPHWNELKAAIESRGLMRFVATSGEQAAKQLTEELAEGKSTQRSYDPLMGANFAIWSNALEKGGLYLMQGDLCPLCELDKQHEKGFHHKAEDWIRFAADEQLEKAKTLGLIPQETM